MMNRWDSRLMGRLSLWLLFAFAVPYALLMLVTGVVWAVWISGPLVTVAWVCTVFMPVWILAIIFYLRRAPHHAGAVVGAAWAMVVALVTIGFAP